LTDQREEVDEEVSVASDDVEGMAAQVDEVLEPFTDLVAAVYHVRHV